MNTLIVMLEIVGASTAVAVGAGLILYLVLIAYGLATLTMEWLDRKIGPKREDGCR